MTTMKAAEKFSEAIEALYMGGQEDPAIDTALSLPPGTTLLWRVLNDCPPNEFGPENRPGRRQKVNLRLLLRLHAQGLSDAEIASIQCVSANAIYLWRTKLGLPPNNAPKKRGEGHQPIANQ